MRVATSAALAVTGRSKELARSQTGSVTQAHACRCDLAGLLVGRTPRSPAVLTRGGRCGADATLGGAQDLDEPFQAPESGAGAVRSPARGSRLVSWAESPGNLRIVAAPGLRLSCRPSVLARVRDSAQRLPGDLRRGPRATASVPGTRSLRRGQEEDEPSVWSRTRSPAPEQLLPPCPREDKDKLPDWAVGRGDTAAQGAGSCTVAPVLQGEAHSSCVVS